MVDLFVVCELVTVDEVRGEAVDLEAVVGIGAVELEGVVMLPRNLTILPHIT